jgi:hypothetical protein
MIAVVPSMIRLSSATSRWTPSEPDYFEDLAGDALVDTRPAERDVLQDGRGQNRPPRKAPVSVAGEGLALIVNTSAGTASTRLARRLAADLPEATVIETDAGDQDSWSFYRTFPSAWFSTRPPRSAWASSV